MAKTSNNAELGKLLAGVLAARARGDARAASDLLARARAMAPEHVDVLHLGAVLAHEGGRDKVATRLIEKASALRPGDAGILRSRGLIAEGTGRRQDAILSFRAALAIRPEDLGLARHLAALLLSEGQTGEAERVLDAVPSELRDAELDLALCDQMRQAGDFAGARRILLRMRMRSPADIGVLTNLANASAALGLDMEAREAFEAALALPVLPEQGAKVAHAYGVFLGRRGATAEAAKFLETAIALQPGRLRPRLDLAGLLMDDESSGGRTNWHFVRAAELSDPDERATRDTDIPANAQVFVDTRGDASRAAAVAFARDFQARHPRVELGPFDDGRHSRGRLRVGYFSADFRHHAVANFILPLLESHDRTRFEVAAYSNVKTPDAVTCRFRAAVDRWVDVYPLSDADVARRIRDDRVDILVDLMGQTAGHRPAVFLARPAPVQVTYLGYAGTTGFDCFEARIVDAETDPPEATDRHFTEPLLRIPGPFLSYRPVVSPERGTDAPPSLEVGHVTFGSFNNLAKITSPTLRAWRRALDAVPGARLLLRNFLSSDPFIRSELSRMLSDSGIDVARVTVAPAASDAVSLLRSYDEVDIALDTYPYGGTTTTCEALWMGVPVVTLSGATHASRVGSSILRHVGLPELVADSEAGFADICARLSADPVALAGLRRGLRSRLAASPLCDADGHARRMEAAYLNLWLRWCANWQDAKTVT